MQYPDAVYAALNTHSISYTVLEHPPVFTIAEAKALYVPPQTMLCKNLFVQNGRKASYFLIIVPEDLQVDLRGLARQMGSSRLSFPPAETLQACLGVSPGAVSPFGLLQDASHSIPVILDDTLSALPSIAFHPCINTATVVLQYADLLRFLQALGNPVQVLHVPGQPSSEQ